MDRYWLILAVSLEQERAVKQLFRDNGWDFEPTNAYSFWSEKKFPKIKKASDEYTTIKVEPLEDVSSELPLRNCTVSIMRPKTVPIYKRHNISTYDPSIHLPDAAPTEYEHYSISSREVDTRPGESLLIPGNWSSGCEVEQGLTDMHNMQVESSPSKDLSKQATNDQLSLVPIGSPSSAFFNPLGMGKGIYESNMDAVENQLNIIAGVNANESNCENYEDAYKESLDEKGTFLIDSINVSDYDADTDVEYVGAEMLEQTKTDQETEQTTTKKKSPKKKGGIKGTDQTTKVRKKRKEASANSNEEPIACKMCDRTFTTEKNYQAHLQKNNGKCYFECEFCNMKFLKRCRLAVHILSKHTKERPHKCHICGKGYVEPDKLKVHIRIHTGEKPCQCDLCGERFHSLGRLSLHKNYHHVWKNQPDKFRCEKCNKKYCSDSTLKYHMKTVHATSRDYMCFICGKSYKAPDSLKYHVKFVHSEERQFKCKDCDKTFKAPSGLRRHQVTHLTNPEKRFVCKICEKAFLDKEKLKMHINVHTGNKPYKCNLCDFSCAFSGNLSKHKRVHKGMLLDQYSHTENNVA